MFVTTTHPIPPGGISQLLSSPSHQLSTAINQYNALVQRADYFKQAYSNVHTCVHYEDTSLREIERLRPLLIPQDHEKLTQNAVHFRGTWAQHMVVHRGHWMDALKELKVVKEKIAGLEKLVAKEEQREAEVVAGEGMVEGVGVDAVVLQRKRRF